MGTVCPIPVRPAYILERPNLRLIDLTGDGFADILLSEDEVLVWYPSRAREGFGPAEIIHKRSDEERGPALVFADSTQSVYLADMHGACQLTSRIKQAIGSVQLFVQRADEPSAWCCSERRRRAALDTWMQNYRVWEANCKVFLSPENWIEPGLRPDKTPFFKDLENELLQGDITNDIENHAEGAEK